ncbi:MAG: hypothetical protein AAF225_07420, partial [Pseudomonadota bacterium]
MAYDGALMLACGADARRPHVGNVLVLPCVPITKFREGLALVGTAPLRNLRLHAQDPTDHAAYLVKTPAGNKAWYADFNDFPKSFPVIGLTRTTSNLLSPPLRALADFPKLVSLTTARPFDLSSDLQALRQVFPDATTFPSSSRSGTPSSVYFTTGTL